MQEKSNENQLILERLPDCEIYQTSYLHRDEIDCIAVSIATNVIATGSQDGVVKFWKKLYKGIEFAKQYRAHLSNVSQIVFSYNGYRAVSSSTADNIIKIYDLLSLDMIDKVDLKEPIFYIELAQDLEDNEPFLIASKQSGLFIYQLNSKPTAVPIEIHNEKVVLLKYNRIYKSCISADSAGIIEYWEKSSKNPPPSLNFTLKVKTDLFTLAKQQETPLSISISPDCEVFCIYSSTRSFYIFHFRTGKLINTFSESFDDYNAIQNSTTSEFRLERIEFHRRMALEKEIERIQEQIQTSFDESSSVLIYPNYLGVQFRNIFTGEVLRVLGKNETPRFNAVILFQGESMLNTSGKAGSGGSSSQGFKEFDPLLLALGFRRTRFYIFSRHNPINENTYDMRDVMNESPTENEKLVTLQLKPSIRLAKSAVIHTTMGDIAIKLFPKQCPKTIENFTGHCLNSFYCQQIFHRVIKGFMIQTGDPEGNGHGGSSIWGGEFEDEVTEELKHDRPFTVSMANRGPNTNGSQFFITTVAASWLNGRHTLFGRVTSGMDTVCRIEGVPCDKKKKPKADIKIIDITIHLD